MRPTGIERDTIHDLAYYEAVPYLLVMESVERQGEWLRRAEYPELPGCAAEAPSAVRTRTVSNPYSAWISSSVPSRTFFPRKIMKIRSHIRSATDISLLGRPEPDLRPASFRLSPILLEG